jgi:hypothetical protein
MIFGLFLKFLPAFTWISQLKRPMFATPHDGLIWAFCWVDTKTDFSCPVHPLLLPSFNFSARIGFEADWIRYPEQWSPLSI